MENCCNVLFSRILSRTELDRVRLYSYFALLETGNGSGFRLLPTDHAIAYPLEAEMQPNRKVVSGDLNFYNEIIYKAYDPQNMIPESKIAYKHPLGKKKKCIVINLIDNCFGHSFLKLYGIYPAHLELSAEYDLVVLTPKAVTHFLPSDKGLVVIEFDLGFNEAMKCHNLEPVLSRLRKEYELVDFLSMHTYKPLPGDRKELVEFFNFTGTHKANGSAKTICFFYRKDSFRKWNGNRQGKNIASFFGLIRPFFDEKIEYYVLGEKDNYVFPSWIRDERISNYNSESDHYYNHLFQRSIMAIGVMGSAMTQASLLAPFAVYLVAEDKLSVVSQDLPNNKVSVVHSHYENIYIYGNGSLSDLTPEILKRRLIALYYAGMGVDYKCYFEEVLFMEGKVMSQSEYFSFKYPFARLDKMAEEKREIARRAKRKRMPEYYWNKITGRLLGKK